MGIREVRNDDFVISMQFAISMAAQAYIFLLTIGFLIYGNAGMSGHPIVAIFVALFSIVGMFLTAGFILYDTKQDYIERRKKLKENGN